MKMEIQVVFIALAISTVLSELDVNYCEIPTCKKCTHTLCKFPETGAVRSCGSVTQLKLTLDEIQDIFLLHNLLRQLAIHERQGKKNEFIFDPNIVHLHYLQNWDDDLSRSAQRWVEQCTEGNDLCRDAARYLVTQRSAITEEPGKLKDLSTNPIIWSWFEQDGFGVPDSTGQVINKVPNATRTIWENASRIGCGLVRSFDNSLNKLYFVCNYGPNIEDPKMKIVQELLK